jgi:hypothetical protein
MKMPAANVVMLNANQTQRLVRNADVANEHGGLRLVGGGNRLTPTCKRWASTPGLRSPGQPTALAFRGREVDMVA